MCNGTEDEEIIFDDFEELKAVVPEGNFFKYFDGLQKSPFFFSIIFEKLFIFYFKVLFAKWTRTGQIL